MPIPNEARFWDQAAPKYARSKIADPAGYQHTLERTLALLGSDDSVLELGCGTGTTALALAGAVDRYLATDISAGMITIAKAKTDATPTDGLQFRTATAETLAEPPASFDAILAFSYLHLVRDLPGTLARIHALLRPGGLFVSKTPCVGEMNLLIRRVLLPAMTAVGKAPHVALFTAAELTHQVDQAGFDILANERHATRGTDLRPYIVARKPG